MMQVFKYIYNNSVLPFERITYSETKTDVSNKINLIDLSYLKETIDKNVSEEQFKKYCERLNLSEDDISLMFSNDYIDQGKDAFPFWIETLHKFSTYESIQKINKTDSELPFYNILFPLVDFSINSIEKRIGKKVSENIVDKLYQFFYRDLVSSCHHVLLDEFSLFL